MPAVRARPEASVVRAAARRRRRRRRGAGQPRIDRGDDGGGHVRPEPDARACSVRRLRSGCPSPASRCSSSTSAPTSRCGPAPGPVRLLGAAFSEAVLGVERPRVGLLSVGEEAGKGREEVVAAHATLVGARRHRLRRKRRGARPDGGGRRRRRHRRLHRQRRAEAMEGTARAVTGAIRDAARSSPLAALGGLLMRPALGGLRREMDPDATGGAILLGLRGIAVVGHGSPAPRGSPTQYASPPAAGEVDAVARTAALLGEAGAGRGALGDETATEAGRDRKRPMTGKKCSPSSATTSPRSSRSTPPRSTRRRASRRTSTPTRSTSTSGDGARGPLRRRGDRGEASRIATVGDAVDFVSSRPDPRATAAGGAASTLAELIDDLPPDLRRTRAHPRHLDRRANRLLRPPRLPRGQRPRPGGRLRLVDRFPDRRCWRADMSL